jgi:hypothetical protein
MDEDYFNANQSNLDFGESAEDAFGSAFNGNDPFQSANNGMQMGN